MTEATPSRQIKTLHRRSGQRGTVSLKDFAVEVGQTTAHHQLVQQWITNKAGDPGVKKETTKNVAVEPPKKSAPKKR